MEVQHVLQRERVKAEQLLTSSLLGAVRSSHRNWSRARCSLMAAASIEVMHGTTVLNPVADA
jgi:hypothetical protein